MILSASSCALSLSSSLETGALSGSYLDCRLVEQGWCFPFLFAQPPAQQDCGALKVRLLRTGAIQGKNDTSASCQHKLGAWNLRHETDSVALNKMRNSLEEKQYHFIYFRYFQCHLTHPPACWVEMYRTSWSQPFKSSTCSRALLSQAVNEICIM